MEQANADLRPHVQHHVPVGDTAARGLAFAAGDAVRQSPDGKVVLGSVGGIPPDFQRGIMRGVGHGAAAKPCTDRKRIDGITFSPDPPASRVGLRIMGMNSRARDANGRRVPMMG
jgi:hypothetical protein